MATAVRTSEERIVRIIQETEMVEFIDIRLTLAEAQVLRDITANIGGNPDTTRRGLTNAIKDALKAAGFEHVTRPDDMIGYINFTETEDTPT